MTQSHEHSRLHHMLTYATEAVEMVEGLQREALDSDRKLNLSLVRLLEVIGEAASCVTEQTRKQHPQIAWTSIVALRNRLIHGYDSVDFDVMWRIVHDDLPLLIAKLQKVV